MPRLCSLSIGPSIGGGDLKARFVLSALLMRHRLRRVNFGVKPRSYVRECRNTEGFSPMPYLCCYHMTTTDGRELGPRRAGGDVTSPLRASLPIPYFAGEREAIIIIIIITVVGCRGHGCRCMGRVPRRSPLVPRPDGGRAWAKTGIWRYLRGFRCSGRHLSRFKIIALIRSIRVVLPFLLRSSRKVFRLLACDLAWGRLQPWCGIAYISMVPYFSSSNGSSSGGCVGSAKAAPYAVHLLMKNERNAYMKSAACVRPRTCMPSRPNV